jgi:UDP-N-acetylenolpyruvoylglucosamine reductase
MAGRALGVSEPNIQSLQSRLRGQLIRPADPAYESARRVYNGMIDKRPAMIVRCADVADVINAVNFARENRLTVAIRGGSHNVAGFAVCDGGLVIDLSSMKGIRVDPVSRTVRIEGGCTWGDVDHATHAFGMAVPGGIISTTGVAGLTLGGGIGYLTRKYGLSCDNLLSADVVTADGNVVTASAKQAPELFWALRGGGGNFGVVTSFEFRLHPVSTVVAGPILYPIEKAREALRVYRDYMNRAPEDFNAFFAFLIVPPGPPFPEHLHMKTLCGVVCCYTGDPRGAADAMRPFTDFGPPAFAHTGEIPFPVLNSIFDPLLPPGLSHYWKADFMRELSEEAIDVYVKYGPAIPTIHSAMHIYAVNGAAQRVRNDETAYSYRDASFGNVIAAVCTDAADIPRHRQWVKEFWSAMHPHSAGGAYVNFLMEEGDERIRASYRGNYGRLVEVKDRYDPENLFHVNQNIRPSGSAAQA